MSTTLPTIERLLEPVTAWLTLEVAKRIVDLRLDDPSTLERLDDLREKANEGTLTAEERAESRLYAGSGYNREYRNKYMTESLQNAFTLVSRLSATDQDAIAAWLLDELDSERKWDALFRDSQDVLADLARDALAEHSCGETENWKLN